MSSRHTTLAATVTAPSARRWLKRVSCSAPTVAQPSRLAFNNVNPPISADASFTDVMIGLDPSAWPIDVHADCTKDAADQRPVRPGGDFSVFGDFCWGGDKGRAVAYFLPSGVPLPPDLASTDVERAKRAEQRLVATAISATTIETSEVRAVFRAPRSYRILHGAGDRSTVRLFVLDNRASRTSGLTPHPLIELRGAAGSWPKK